MKFSTCFALVTGLTAIPLLVLITGCGGAALDYGQTRNLESVEPNFVNPPWYDLYAEDPEAPAKKYKEKVLQLDLKIVEFGETSGGITVIGATGEDDMYRVTCFFAQAHSTRVQSYSAGDRMSVKGVFHHIEDAGNTSHLHLAGCVLVRR